MTFWRPAYQWRGLSEPWFTNTRLMSCEMSHQAAKAIYRCFNLVPDLGVPANDTDHLRW